MVKNVCVCNVCLSGLFLFININVCNFYLVIIKINILYLFCKVRYIYDNYFFNFVYKLENRWFECVVFEL